MTERGGGGEVLSQRGEVFFGLAVVFSRGVAAFCHWVEVPALLVAVFSRAVALVGLGGVVFSRAVEVWARRVAASRRRR